MRCKKYRNSLSDYIDGAMSEAGRTRLESHLSHCAGCREKLEDLRNYQRFASSFSMKEAPGSIRKEVWQAISRDAEGTPVDQGGKVISLYIARALLAASLLAAALILPFLLRPTGITINFDVQVESKGRGPVEKEGTRGEADPRVDAVNLLAVELGCKVKRVEVNPSGLTDAMTLKVPKTQYNRFREGFNRNNPAEPMPEIDFRTDRGSVIVQMYFSGRKFFTGDYNKDGLVDIGAYFNRGRHSGKFFVAFNDGEDGFLEPVVFTLRDTLRFLQRSDELFGADFNNDGLADLAVFFTGRTNPDTWFVYLNNGKQEFERGLAWKSGEGKLALPGEGYTFTGDFNGDGYCDLGTHFIRGVNAGKFFVSPNTKELSFDDPVEFETGLSGLTTGGKYLPVTLDINNDEYADIVLYWQEGERTAMWYLAENNGMGSSGEEQLLVFNRKSGLAFWGNYLPFTGDMNGDGFDDLLVKTGTADEVSTWYLMMNDGNGSFNTAGHFIDFNGGVDFVVR